MDSFTALTFDDLPDTTIVMTQGPTGTGNGEVECSVRWRWKVEAFVHLCRKRKFSLCDYDMDGCYLDDVLVGLARLLVWHSNQNGQVSDVALQRKLDQLELLSGHMRLLDWPDLPGVAATHFAKTYEVFHYGLLADGWRALLTVKQRGLQALSSMQLSQAIPSRLFLLALGRPLVTHHELMRDIG